MKISINNATFEYESDFATNKKEWKKKFKDAFRIDRIGGTTCFIKRFVDYPQAGDLLQEIKGKPVMYMPQVYDLVESKEEGKSVYYLFIEFIEGKTLKEYILANGQPEPKEIGAAVGNALKFIHQRGFWFSDFNEENIFRTNDGKFLLIDVDSCWPDKYRPANDPARPGGMPGLAQEFATVVVNFYKEINEPHRPDFEYKDIEGKNMNCLQLIALIGKLQFFVESKSQNSNTSYVRMPIYKKLHFYLLAKNQAYCRGLFRHALTEQLNYEMIIQLLKYITGENQMGTKTENPVIEIFHATSTEIFAGKEASLRWKVTDATKVTLTTKSTNIILQVRPESSLDVKPSSNETYVLNAVSKSGVQTSKSVMIAVAKSKNPEIVFFNADKARAKKQEAIHFKWQVNHADRVYLNSTVYPNDAKGATIFATQSTLYTLVAENSAGERVSQSITIGRKYNSMWAITAVLALLCIIVGIVGFWQYGISNRYENAVSWAETARQENDFHEAANYYRWAEKLRQKGWFTGSHNWTSEANQAEADGYKLEGDALLDKGNILDIPDQPDSPSAINSYQNAQQYIPDDDEINTKLGFCEKVKTARSYRLNQDWINAIPAYEQAISFGQKSKISEKVLDILREVINTIKETQITVDSCTTNHVVYNEEGELCLKVTVDLKTDFITKSGYKISVYFYDDQQEKIIADATKTDGKYRTSDNQIAMTKTLEPNLVAQTQYYFVPYRIFSASNAKPYGLFPAPNGKFKFVIFAPDNRVVWVSGYYPIFSK